MSISTEKVQKIIQAILDYNIFIQAAKDLVKQGDTREYIKQLSETQMIKWDVPTSYEQADFLNLADTSLNEMKEAHAYLKAGGKHTKATKVSKTLEDWLKEDTEENLLRDLNFNPKTIVFSDTEGATPGLGAGDSTKFGGLSFVQDPGKSIAADPTEQGLTFTQPPVSDFLRTGVSSPSGRSTTSAQQDPNVRDQLNKMGIPPTYDYTTFGDPYKRSISETEKVHVTGDTIFNYIGSLGIDIDEVANTLTFEGELSKDEMKKVIYWVAYSCLNGPVGKKKSITVKGSVIAGADIKATGGQLKKLCKEFKDRVLATRTISCIMRERYGDYYPCARFEADHPANKK